MVRTMTVAIVLAGGANSLVKIGDRCAVEYVIEALRGSSYVDRMIIAGPVEALRERCLQDGTRQGLPEKKMTLQVVKAGATPVESFRQAYSLVPPETGRLLLVTGDIPLLTAEAIDHFIETCRALEGDFFYPIVSKKVNEEKYPGVERTYVSLREGVFTGGNLILLKTGIVQKCLQEAEQIVRLRKRPIALASHIGWKVLWSYLTRRLSIEQAEREVSRLLGGVKGVGVISPYPEIGLDVDKESDLRVVKKALGLTERAV
ncbi:MAG TPA: nucleotidyltransferase family protein [Peptococcaceae bacterium]|jgi:molybdopterin-guanine dinucleotide biosynthesis protein A|nr:nucleotidyltransferase family protein [Peptococcaceae bacterium]HPZ71214.1 nucleotidyltransferase family protein [Peptococcaceae bacterium]HQD53930.1 nucleotidyltransferase family protein [Peptococcaceae bacterium]